jgi:hypothetical protein
MRTIENPYTAEFSRLRKLGDDAALVWRFAKMLIGYYTVGRRVRKLYRECETSGKVLWLDADSEERRRELQ